ncbi:hypothetical protein F5878DRAFT_608165 [Lentinula raphanica]|uniref:C2H2-type domain-containing protein n=1 Tax=Lentinula raphanica TaxID=153919 RepID=A0AA38PGI0_9AGAR|nr:hypothetical protein F5878DRAFT_608165 [Lentinula raphanica]
MAGCCSPADIFSSEFDLKNGSDLSLYFGKDDSRSNMEHDTELEPSAPRDLCSPSRPECDRSCNKIPSKSSPPLFMNPSGSMYRGDKPLFKGSKKNRDLKQKDRGVPLNASSKPSKSGTHNFIFSRSSSITKPISTSSSATKIKQGGEETEISHHLVTSHHRAAKRAVIYRYQYGQVDDDDGDDASEYEDSVDDDEYDDNNNFCTPSRKRKRKKSSYRPKQPPLSYPQVAAKQITRKKAKTDRDVDLVCGPSYQRSPLEPIASGSDSQRSKRGKDSQRLKKGKGKPVQIANPSAEEPEKEKVPCEDCGKTFIRGWDLSRHRETACPKLKVGILRGEDLQSLLQREPRLQCRYCLSIFSRVDACQRHMRENCRIRQRDLENSDQDSESSDQA